MKQANGPLLASVIFGLLLGLLLSTVMLIAYRRSLRRLMNLNADNPDDPLPVQQDSPSPVESLPRSQPASASLLNVATARRRRCAIVYALAGAACSAALTMVLLSESGMVKLSPFLTVFAFNLWPLLLTLNLILRWTWKRTSLYSLLYFAVLAVLIYIQVERGSKNTPLRLIAFFFLLNAPSTILFRAISLKGIRQVGPTLLPLCFIGIAGPLVVLNIGSGESSIAERISRFSMSLHLGSLTGPALLFLVNFAILGLFGWLAAYGLVRLYKSQRISDQSLLIDSIWIVYIGFEALVHSAHTGSETGFSNFWIVIALPLYLIGVHGGLRVAGLSRQPQPATLLVLRAFALKAKAERIFQPVTSLWRYIGPIRLIGGPDLASATIQPDSFFEFATGHMNRLFIGSSASLDARMNALAPSPDPDGRFRVQDLFCHRNTWQLAVTRLLYSSDIVLADFRGLSQTDRNGRGGCEWEVSEIAATIGLDRCIFLLDGPEDEAYLHSLLAADESHSARILHGVTNTERSLKRLVTELFAFSPSSPPAPDSQLTAAD